MNTMCREAWSLFTAILNGIELPQVAVEMLFCKSVVMESDLLRVNVPRPTIDRLVSIGAVVRQGGSSTRGRRGALGHLSSRVVGVGTGVGIDLTHFTVVVGETLSALRAGCRGGGVSALKERWMMCLVCGHGVCPALVCSTCPGCGTGKDFVSGPAIFLSTPDDVLEVMKTTGMLYILEEALPRHAMERATRARREEAMKRQTVNPAPELAVEVDVVLTIRPQGRTFPSVLSPALSDDEQWEEVEL